MITMETERQTVDEKMTRAKNGIDLAGLAYKRAARAKIAGGAALSEAELILRNIQGRQRDGYVEGALPLTQTSIDLMRGSDETSVKMGPADPQRFLILAACRGATEVIRNGGDCIMPSARPGEQCVRYGAALLMLQQPQTITPVTIR